MSLCVVEACSGGSGAARRRSAAARQKPSPDPNPFLNLPHDVGSAPRCAAATWCTTRSWARAACWWRPRTWARSRWAPTSTCACSVTASAAATARRAPGAAVVSRPPGSGSACTCVGLCVLCAATLGVAASSGQCGKGPSPGCAASEAARLASGPGRSLGQLQVEATASCRIPVMQAERGAGAGQLGQL
jgi:hypothetical protein